MNHTDTQLLEMTPLGRKALRRRREQGVLDDPATFADTAHLDATGRGHQEGAKDGAHHYYMGGSEMDEVLLPYAAGAAFSTREVGNTSEAEKAAYTDAYSAAYRTAYRAAQAKGEPQGPPGADGALSPALRRTLLNATPLGRKILANEGRR